MTSWLWPYACYSPGGGAHCSEQYWPAAAFLQVPRSVPWNRSICTFSGESLLCLSILSPLFPLTHPASHAKLCPLVSLLRILRSSSLAAMSTNSLTFLNIPKNDHWCHKQVNQQYSTWTTRCQPLYTNQSQRPTDSTKYMSSWIHDRNFP